MMIDQMNPVERFGAFVAKFARDRGIPVEEALNLTIVKEYRAWIDKEFANDSTREERILETV